MENPYAAPRGEIVTPSGGSPPLTWKQILFSFEGRIPRRQYWGSMLIQILGGLIIGFLLMSMIPSLFGSHGSASSLAPMLGVILAPLAIVVIWIGLAVGVKRWHDRGKAGWWMLIGFIPYIGGIWQFIECGCLRGTEGSNRFGDDPT